MEYRIGRSGESTFLIQNPVEGEMLATPALRAFYASLQMKAIKEYLQKGKGEEQSPAEKAVAWRDYERIKNDSHSMIGLDLLVSSIHSLAGKELPPSKISQNLIRSAYTDALLCFNLAGIPLYK